MARLSRKQMIFILEQQLAVQYLKEAYKYADGWGVMVTNMGTRIEDGQCWMHYEIALELERKGVVELDEQFGRVRLLKK